MISYHKVMAASGLDLTPALGALSDTRCCHAGAQRSSGVGSSISGPHTECTYTHTYMYIYKEYIGPQASGSQNLRYALISSLSSTQDVQLGTRLTGGYRSSY